MDDRRAFTIMRGIHVMQGAMQAAGIPGPFKVVVSTEAWMRIHAAMSALAVVNEGRRDGKTIIAGVEIVEAVGRPIQGASPF